MKLSSQIEDSIEIRSSGLDEQEQKFYLGHKEALRDFLKKASKKGRRAKDYFRTSLCFKPKKDFGFFGLDKLDTLILGGIAFDGMVLQLVFSLRFGILGYLLSLLLGLFALALAWSLMPAARVASLEEIDSGLTKRVLDYAIDQLGDECFLDHKWIREIYKEDGEDGKLARGYFLLILIK